MLKWTRSANGVLYAVVDGFIIRLYKSKGRQKLSLVFREELDDEEDAIHLAENIAIDFRLTAFS